MSRINIYSVLMFLLTGVFCEKWKNNSIFFNLITILGSSQTVSMLMG